MGWEVDRTGSDSFPVDYLIPNFIENRSEFQEAKRRTRLIYGLIASFHECSEFRVT
jgi:hypothetical protein